MTKFNEMTPKEIVAELDKYIIGQDKTKKSVAVALKNKYRKNNEIRFRELCINCGQ